MDSRQQPPCSIATIPLIEAFNDGIPEVFKRQNFCPVYPCDEGCAKGDRTFRRINDPACESTVDRLCLVKTWSSRLVARWSRTDVGDLVPDSSGDPWSLLEIVGPHVKWNAAMGWTTNVSNSGAVSSGMRDRSQGQAYLQAPTMPLGSCLPSRGVSIAHPGLG